MDISEVVDENTDTSTDPENINLLLTEVEKRCDFQLHVKTTHEAKAQVIIAFVGVMYGLMMTAYETLIKLSEIDKVLIIASIVCFAVSLVLSTLILRNSGYKSVPNPIRLIDGYFYSSEEDTKKVLLHTLTKAYKENYEVIEKKAKTLNIAFYLLMSAFSLYGIALLLSVIGA